LGDADHHHPEAPLALGLLQIGTRHLLLGLALAETHHRDLVVEREAVDRGHVGATDLAQQRRRRDRVATVEQEADQLPLAHQPRHVALQEEPVDRTHPQRHVVTQ
jgi:hypothetical protein